MRPWIKELVRLCAESLPLKEPVYDFGSWQAPGQAWGDLRPLFPRKEFVGADMREGPGVDRLMNIHSLHMADEAIGTALCMDTLEHVEYPRRAITEVYRVLKPDGVFILSTVLDFRIHDYPGDFWRFTPAGLESLLSAFPVRVVEAMGKADFPHTVVAVAVKNETPPEGWGELLGDSRNGRFRDDPSAFDSDADLPDDAEASVDDGYCDPVYRATHPGRVRAYHR